MGTMTTISPGRPGGLTRIDLERMRESTDDGRRYELIDGVVFVTPSPSRRHQVAASGLVELLLGLDRDLRVLFAPLDVDFAEDTVVQPDVLVVRRAEFDDESLPVRPLLVVEVLSPSTRGVDALLKRERYQRAGVPSYWLVDPLVPSVTVLELRDGAYAEVAIVRDDEMLHVEQPARLTIVPAGLLD